ncbi:MAG: hypothetical protein Q7R39_09385 [Dehalococcoidia bacterium]|nr:hypothetical protein [Dehalococcoidia bacterium]
MPRRAFALVAILAIVASFVVLLRPTTTTSALPDYAAKTGQACGACHVSAAGGGPRTAKGDAFAAIPTHAPDPVGAWAQVSGAAAPAPAPATAPAPASKISVAFSGAATDDSVIYTIRVLNGGDKDISNIYIAGSIPSGATFGSAVSTPEGAGFFSSTGGVAAWLMGTLSSATGNNAAIFSYRVSKGSASNLTASAFMHWLAPSDGTASSAAVAPITNDQRAAVNEAVKEGLTNLDRSTTLWNIQPGLGTIMIEYATRMNNLWFAAQAGNWDMATYQTSEMTEIQEVGENTRPARAPALKAFESTYLDPLLDAAADKDINAFVARYDAAIGGCNSCHASQTGAPSGGTFKFVKIQRPTVPTMSNIDWKGQ